MRLRLGERAVGLENGGPLVVGILNVTPDSFSDGGRWHGADAQVARGLELAAAGAHVVEVGGESSVSDRAPVAAALEIERVVPVVRRLAAEGVTVAVDTWKAEVARAALEAGAAMVNDVSGLRDLGVAEACAKSGAALVVTHTRGEPKRKAFPRYDDLVSEVVDFLRSRLAAAERCGVAREQLIVDPGLDLAKTPAGSVDLLRRLGELRSLGRPVMLAASRKDFIGAITGRPPADRLAGTLAAIGAGLDAGAALLRVHDVAEVADFLRVRGALRGELAVEPGLRLDERLRHEGRAA